MTPLCERCKGTGREPRCECEGYRSASNYEIAGSLCICLHARNEHNPNCGGTDE
jgi:hypothetical protein